MKLRPRPALAVCLSAALLPALTGADEPRGAHIAYTFADQPSAASYTPSGPRTVNPHGAVTITRRGLGVYTVRFAGLGAIVTARSRLGASGEAGAAGHVQVSTNGGGGLNCKAASWGIPLGSARSLDVDVRCFDTAGRPADSRYSVLFLEPDVDAGQLGFLVSREAAASSVAEGTLTFNGAGGPVRITRLSAGRYTARFENMARFALAGVTGGGAQVHVAARGTDNRSCQSSGWFPSGSHFDASVRCFAPDGTAADATFALLALWPGSYVYHHAYAHADQPAAASYTPASFSNEDRPVQITRAGVGQYRAVFTGFHAGRTGGHVQVTARRTSRATCRASLWGASGDDLAAAVQCYDVAGRNMDAAFAISAFFGLGPVPGDPHRLVDFDAAAHGDVLVNDFLALGVRFPDGVEVITCGSSHGDCPRSRSPRNVAAPRWSTEFSRAPFHVEFTSAQRAVTLSINGGFIQNGDLRMVTATAYDAGGMRVATVNTAVRSTPRWETRVHLATATALIRRVSVTARLSTWPTADNHIVVDNLYFSDSAPPPADTVAPTVFSTTHTNGQTVTSSDLRLGVRARDDRALDRVTGQVVRVADGRVVWPASALSDQLCGPAATACPASTTFESTLAASLPTPDDYRVTLRAWDAAGNTDTEVLTITYAAPAPTPRAFVHKVEFNQSVTTHLYDRFIFSPQNPFLIPGKNVLLRYYIHSEEAPRAAFAATLRVDVTRTDGTRLSRGLAPNAGRSSVDLVPLPPDTGTSRRDALVTMRADLARTLNFVIPGDWLNDASFIEIVLWDGIRDISRAQIHDTGRNRSILALQLFLLNGTPRETFETQVRPYLEQALPFSEVRILSARGLTWTGPAFAGSSLCETLLFFQRWRSDDYGPGGLPTDGRFWMSRPVIGEIGCQGLGEVGGNNLIARAVGGSVAHEIGHNTGLLHASDAHGESDGGGWTPWPYYHGAIGRFETTFGAILQPVRAPSGTDAGSWSAWIVDPCPAATTADRFAPCAPMDSMPDHGTVPHELMSYGTGGSLDGTPVPGTRGRWPSWDTYNHFYTRTSAPASARMAADTASETSFGSGAADTPVLVVTTLVAPNGAASLLPVMQRRASAGELSRQKTGDYHVELRGADGQILASAQVGPLVLSAEEHGEGEGPQATFVEALLPAVDGVASVRVSRQGAPLLEQKASPHVPTVRIQTPRGGETFTQGTLAIRWSASDADGDTLYHMVEYTPDGGARWQTLDLVLPGQPVEVDVDVASLVPGTRGRIRITVSDGLRITQALSDGYFTVGDGTTLPLTGTLRVDPDRVRAGAPVTFTATLDNGGADPVAGAAVFRLTSMNGKDEREWRAPFQVVAGGTTDVRPHVPSLDVPPRAYELSLSVEVGGRAQPIARERLVVTGPPVRKR